MAVETDIERAIFVDIDDFAVAATYVKSGGGTSTVNGIFDNEYFGADAQAGVLFVSAQPRFLIRSSDLPTGATFGDTITISAIAYTVRVIQPDGTGMTTLVLEKN
jgi:hypothetical protein